MNRFKNWKNPIFDEDGWAYEDSGWKSCPIRKKYGWRCLHSDNLKLGKNIDIGNFTHMNAKYIIEIGDNVQMGPHCSIISEDTESGINGKISIGDNTVIGAYTLILPNSNIPANIKVRARSIIRGSGDKTILFDVIDNEWREI